MIPTEISVLPLHSALFMSLPGRAEIALILPAKRAPFNYGVSMYTSPNNPVKWLISIEYLLSSYNRGNWQHNVRQYRFFRSLLVGRRTHDTITAGGSGVRLEILVPLTANGRISTHY
jgi:hypothetical protein